MTNTIDIGVRLKDGVLVVFHLRVISVAEDNRYLNRFLEVKPSDTEERKAEQEFEIYVDALASWAAAPVGVKREGDDEIPLYLDAATPADSVKRFFAEKDPITERIAPAIIGNYRNKLQPDVVFF